MMLTSFSDDEVDGLIWTIAEPATGIICSCLPILRPVIIGARNKYRSIRSRSSSSRLHNSSEDIEVNETRPRQRSERSGSIWNTHNHSHTTYSLDDLGPGLESKSGVTPLDRV